MESSCEVQLLIQIIKIIEKFTPKVLRRIASASWFVLYNIIARDLPKVKEENKKFSESYTKRLESHPNKFAKNLVS